MPVVRTPISKSQLAELFGLEPEQFVGIDRTLQGWTVVSEGDDMNTSGTFPQLNSGKKTKGGKKGKRGC
jgi:hypothetical protein